MKNKILLYLLVFISTLFSQVYTSENGVPKDSSYTVIGYFQKELKNFPFIKIANADDVHNVKKETNIIYKTIGNRELKLDLFYPAVINDKIPIIIFIHGGGWRSGDKTFQHPLAIKIASEGYLCAAVEYRLSPEAKYPAAVHDIKSAVKWIKLNAKKYNGDSSNVILSGCSSGGHLAALCGLTNGIGIFESLDTLFNVSTNVAGIIDIDGIVDFTHPAESGKDTNKMFPSVGKLWLGESYSDNPALWVEASPITYISDDDPDIIFINSSIERFHAGREILVNKYKEFNREVVIHTFEKTPHTFWLFEPWYNETVNVIIHFLNKRYKTSQF